MVSFFSSSLLLWPQLGILRFSWHFWLTFYLASRLVVVHEVIGMAMTRVHYQHTPVEAAFLANKCPRV